MFIIPLLPVSSDWLYALFDSTILLVLIFPLLYIFVFHPVMLHISARKQTEEVLKESEDKYRKITNNANEAILVAQDGVLKFANPKGEELYGYSQDELASKPLTYFIHEEDKEMVRERHERLLSGEDLPQIYPFRIIDKSGNIKWVELKVTLLSWDERPAALCFMTDITERKQTEEALSDSEHRYREIVEGTDDLITRVDDKGNFTFVNYMAEIIFGLPPKDCIGLSAFDFIHPDDKERTQKAFSGWVSNRIKSATIENRQVSGTGDVHHMLWISNLHYDEGGILNEVTGIARDITLRKQAEEALQESEGRLKRFYDAAFEGIGITERGKILDVNPRFTEIFGYQRDELIGMDVMNLIAEEDRELVLRNIRSGFNKSYEHRGMHKDGSIRYLEVHGQQIQYRGRPAMVTAIHDITARNRAEEALQESKRQLFQAQKMESLGTLVAGVAHEINNPINLIMFNIPLLQNVWEDFLPVMDEIAVREPNRKYGGLTLSYLRKKLDPLLSDTELAANRIAKIVESLKNFSGQSDVADQYPMQINEAVENALKLAQSTLRKSNVAVELELGENLPSLYGNKQSIEQVILNLIINAAQAIDHDQGRINIVTGLKEEVKSIVISIADNGTGIDPSISDRIFDPFITDKQTEGGTGLGLSVTYSLVKSHGGDISFESQKGVGTTFTVCLPTKPIEKQAKILIVDDDKQIIEALTNALEKHDSYLVEAVENGIEACILLGSYQPDLLILDINMPEMDGVEVCRTIQRDPNLSDIMVMIITGNPDDPKVKKVAELGYTRIHPKPLDLKYFLKEVDNLFKTPQGKPS